MYEDIKEIPGYITGCGAASATIESYIAAAKDLQQAHEYEVMILQGIFYYNDFSLLMKKKDADKAEISYSCKMYRKQYLENSDLLHKFIEERKAQKWE